MSFFAKVYENLKTVPKGQIITYGILAKMCGNPKMSRQVGWALHVNPDPKTIPCHRVVNKDGYLSGGFAFGGIEVQKLLLEKEGVPVSDDFKVDLNRYLYKPIIKEKTV